MFVYNSSQFGSSSTVWN